MGLRTSKAQMQHFKNCIFSHNNATNSGVIYAFDSLVNLTYCKFNNNYYNFSLLSEDPSSKFYISDIVLVDNIASGVTENCSTSYFFTGGVISACEHILCSSAICNCNNYSCHDGAYFSNSSFTSTPIITSSKSASIIISKSASIITSKITSTTKGTIDKVAIASGVVGGTVAVTLGISVVYGYIYGFASLAKICKGCCTTKDSDKNMRRVSNIKKEKELDSFI